MRLVGRQDWWLVIGLVSALVVVFAQPLQRMLDIVRDVEQQLGLALLPALLILTVILIFHEQAKRYEVSVKVAATTALAREASTRVTELEQLVVLGQALARALDLDALREALWRHLASVVGTREAWVLLRVEGGWERLAGGPATPVTPEAPEAIAERALASDEAESFDSGPQWGGHYCFPLRVGDSSLGVLGVREGQEPLTENQWQKLAAAAALLAIAIRNVQLFRETREISLLDALTGCFNRAHALDTLDVELRRSKRSNLPLSIIMFDIDHFKEVNDRHGHLCGDAVLAVVGRRLKELLRNSDVKCRYGGEEFLLILPDTSLAGAIHVAEWLRRELADAKVAWGSEVVSVTASFGVTTAVGGERDPKALIARADAELYRAKRDGRNCVRADEGGAVAADARTIDRFEPIV